MWVNIFLGICLLTGPWARVLGDISDDDNDGVQDALDIDDDNDGVLDIGINNNISFYFPPKNNRFIVI